uniref:Phosphoglucomutase n=1 Tax=Heterorhabditis bacteriophora TaxID=37862 RepID=A0A1I7XAQ4_HETBA
MCPQAFYTRCGCVAWSRSRIHRPLLAVASDDKKAASDERIVIYEHNENLRKWQRIVALKLDLPSPVTDLSFSPISFADSHQLAIAAGDVLIYNIMNPASAFVDDDNGIPDSIPTNATEYSANKIAVLGDQQKAWRIKYNVTGTVLTASSGDGTVRVWKGWPALSLFLQNLCYYYMASKVQEELMAKVANWLSWDKVCFIHYFIFLIPKKILYLIRFRFAQLAANVFISNGIPVYLFSDVSPTPLVSWATVALKCDAEDNGYKAYWSNGAQVIESIIDAIIGPHDTEIVRLAELNPEPREEYWDLSTLNTSPLMRSADGSINTYFETERSLAYHREINSTTPLKFTYSAFHGVGYHFAKRMFNEFGFPEECFISVKEQQEPDPDFPTVPFPNPEEGTRVLTLSLETAEKHGSTIVLANDPDADRIQLAEKNVNGEWRVFTGNEMGALLTWWIWINWQKANPNIRSTDVYILNSAVSSQIVKTIAEIEGFKNDVTLTGFKWMGNRAEELRKAGKHVILAWEESIGYMPGHTLDKFPELIGTETVLSVRDLTIGYDNSQPGNKPVLPISTSSEMVTFTLANGSIVTLRASGTEPKLKYYIELKTPPGKKESDLSSVLRDLDQLEKDVVATLLRPQQFGLIPRK